METAFHKLWLSHPWRITLKGTCSQLTMLCLACWSIWPHTISPIQVSNGNFHMISTGPMTWVSCSFWVEIPDETIWTLQWVALLCNNKRNQPSKTSRGIKDYNIGLLNQLQEVLVPEASFRHCSNRSGYDILHSNQFFNHIMQEQETFAVSEKQTSKQIYMHALLTW